jgi:hypothetical protein
MMILETGPSGPVSVRWSIAVALVGIVLLLSSIPRGRDATKKPPPPEETTRSTDAPRRNP